MTPAGAIAALDRQVAAHGQDVVLRREFGLAPNQTYYEVALRAFVRDYSSEELVGDIVQGDTKVIFSSTEIARSGWPGPQVEGIEGDPRWPRKGKDKIVIAGRQRTVQWAAPIYFGGDLVRIDARVRG